MAKLGDSQTCQLLRVWRVIKGSNLLGHVRHKVSSTTEYGEEITLPVAGFANKSICRSHMKQGETRVIFANLSSDSTQLIVAETPLHINQRNLNEVEQLANVNNNSDLCRYTRCFYGANCIDGACQCHIDCSPHDLTFGPVCGSDGITYLNKCNIMKQSCMAQKSITTQYRGKCRVNTGRVCANDAECSKPGQVCDGGQCKCGTCSHVYERPVCGSDGTSYQSQCDLARRQCVENRADISIAHDGICQQCEAVYWGGQATHNRRYCTDRCKSCPTEYKPVCSEDKVSYKNACLARCNGVTSVTEGSCYDNFRVKYESTCSGDCSNRECVFIDGEQVCTCMMCPAAEPNQLVCGTDGRNYPSECILMRSNCEFDTQVDVAHSGPCPPNLPTDNGCGNCGHNGVCVNGLCKCDFHCSDLSAPVCGSNGELFINECYLQQQECILQKSITVLDNLESCASECTDKSNMAHCPIYSVGCVNGKCQCPTCESGMFYDQVCGSDGEYYKSRCHLRQQACERREMLFEVPCDDGFDRSEYSEYESSGAMECIYGAAPGYDDEDCLCEWHCPSDADAVRGSDGNVYLNECHLYRDGKCQRQRDVKETSLCGSTCLNDNVLDSTVCGTSGSCLCMPRHVGTTCQECPFEYYKENGHCAFCGCSTTGSHSTQCDVNGVCPCKSGHEGEKCDKLSDATIEDCARCHDLDRRSGEICASDNRFYASICAMKKINCIDPPYTGSQPYQVANDVCRYSQEQITTQVQVLTTMAPTMPPTAPPATPPTLATTPESVYVPPISTILYTTARYDEIDDEIDDGYDREGSADYNDPTDDDDLTEASGDYDVYEPSLEEPTYNYAGKHEPDTYVEINQAQYQIKIHLSDSSWRGEELLETATDKVKSTLQKMIPDIEQIEVNNANIKGDYILADLLVSPFQEPRRLMDEFDAYLEQDSDDASIKSIEIVRSGWFGGLSFARYSFRDTDSAYHLSVKLRMKTQWSDGLLLWIGPNVDNLDGIRSHETPSLSLVVKNGIVQLFTGTESLQQDGARVDDNEWHVIDIKFNRGSVSLKLDDFIEDYIYTGTDEVRISNFYVGGVPEEAEVMVLGPLEVNQGFTGCIEILKTSIQDETEKQVKLCSSTSPCQSEEVGVQQCHSAGGCVELPVDDFVCQKSPAALKSSTNQMAFNGQSYAVIPVMSLTSIKVDFKTSSDRTTYILFSVGKKLICAMVNGRLSMYIEENGVMGHLYTSSTPFDADTDSHIGLALKNSRIDLEYCQGKCAQPLVKHFDLEVSIANDQIIFGKLHKSLHKYTEDDLERYPAFNSVITSLEVDGQTRNLWSGATLLRAVEESTSPMTYMKKHRDINEWYNFQEPNKYLFPDDKKHFSELKMSFKFKTKNTDGTLVYFSNNDESDFLRISLVDGYVRLIVTITDYQGSTEVLEFDSYYSHADGQEHQVDIIIENDERDDCKAVEMTITGGASSYTDYNFDRLYTLDMLESNGMLMVGGDSAQNDSQHHNSNLDGCMAQLTINDIAVHFIDDARHTGPINAQQNADQSASC